MPNEFQEAIGKLNLADQANEGAVMKALLRSYLGSCADEDFRNNGTESLKANLRATVAWVTGWDRQHLLRFGLIYQGIKDKPTPSISDILTSINIFMGDIYKNQAGHHEREFELHL